MFSLACSGNNSDVNFNSIVSSQSCCIKETKTDIKSLSKDTLGVIFGFLNGKALSESCLVSKQWRQIASQDTLWREVIRREKKAFGKEQWATHFGVDIGKETPLPPIKNRSKDEMLVLIPKSINGKPLTINSFGELVKKYFPENDAGYRFIGSAIVAEHGNTEYGEPRWVWMKTDVFPESRGKSYAKQIALAEAQLHYHVPNVLEAIVCIFSKYVQTGERLFGDNPWTYTRCQEQVNGCQVLVGGFSSCGLFVFDSDFDRDYFGVAALRKLQLCTNRVPGSEMPGVPALQISAIVLPANRSARMGSSFMASLNLWKLFKGFRRP